MPNVQQQNGHFKPMKTTIPDAFLAASVVAPFGDVRERRPESGEH